MAVTGYQNSSALQFEEGGDARTSHTIPTGVQHLPPHQLAPEQTLTDKALALRKQVDRCHDALDSIGWLITQEPSEKDPTEPGLAAHLQWTESSVANLLNRLNTLAEYLGRL